MFKGYTMAELRDLLKIKIYTYPNLGDKIRFKFGLRKEFIYDILRLYLCKLLDKNIFSFLIFLCKDKPHPCDILKRLVTDGLPEHGWFYDKWHVFVEGDCVWYINRVRLDSDDDLHTMYF